MLDLNTVNLDDMHLFAVEFTTADGVDGRLALTDRDELVVDVAGFTGLVFCNADELHYYVEFDGNQMVLDKEVFCTVTDVQYETKAEFNEFCERCDMEYYL